MLKIIAAGATVAALAMAISAPAQAAPAWRAANCASVGGKTTSVKAPTNPTAGVAVKVGKAAPQILTQGGAKPVSTLITKDLVSGSGPAVTAGQQITVQYCGVGLKSGKVFDSSYSRGGQAVSFPLSGLIKGWQDGIPGMKVGGTRLLIVPADQAYGQNPPPGSGIGAGESLVFTVQLVK